MGYYERNYLDDELRHKKFEDTDWYFNADSLTANDAVFARLRLGVASSEKFLWSLMRELPVDLAEPEFWAAVCMPDTSDAAMFRIFVPRGFNFKEMLAFRILREGNIRQKQTASLYLERQGYNRPVTDNEPELGEHIPPKFEYPDENRNVEPIRGRMTPAPEDWD